MSGQDGDMGAAELYGKLRVLGMPRRQAGAPGIDGVSVSSRLVVFDRDVFERWLNRMDPEAIARGAVTMYFETLERAGVEKLIDGRFHTFDGWASTPEHHDALAAAVTECLDGLGVADAEVRGEARAEVRTLFERMVLVRIEGGGGWAPDDLDEALCGAIEGEQLALERSVAYIDSAEVVPFDVAGGS